MPNRNVIKLYSPDTYYHVYNRGVNGRTIFKEQQDYHVFLNLLKRYLSAEPVKDKQGREYPWLREDIELLAFCLMPNHFHLLVYQKNNKDAATRLLRGVSTAYTVYFNKKYKRRGPLFQERFKASSIDKDNYLHHVSRYIHLNPKGYRQWEFSSLDYYLGRKSAEWINPGLILDLFEPGEYSDFLSDYEDYKRVMDEVKPELADS